MKGVVSRETKMANKWKMYLTQIKLFDVFNKNKTKKDKTRKELFMTEKRNTMHYSSLSEKKRRNIFMGIFRSCGHKINY